MKVTALSYWDKPYTPLFKVPVNPNVDLTATPFDQVRLMTGGTFFARLAKLLEDNPPYPADSRLISALKRLGVEPGKALDPAKLDPAVLRGINMAPSEVWKQFWAGPYSMNAPNGWINILDFGDFGTDYVNRAFLSFMGLGAFNEGGRLSNRVR